MDDLYIVEGWELRDPDRAAVLEACIEECLDRGYYVDTMMDPVHDRLLVKVIDCENKEIEWLKPSSRLI